MSGFMVTTLYGRESKKPLVQIEMKGIANKRATIQLDIATAREFAMNVLQAAESAIQDAFIIEFFQDLGIEDDQRQAVLAAFREKRRDRQDDLTG
jgi:hypothetical protein